MDEFMCSFLRDLDKFITDIDKWLMSWVSKCWNDEPPPEERELLMWEDVLREDYI
jgi:hypothetical protein